MDKHISKGLGRLLFFCILVMPVSVLAQPTFTKVFSPTTIGPGSVSTLTFTITNTDPSPVDSMAFSDTLPAGVTIANPSNVASSCTVSTDTVSAPAGGTAISLSDGILGGGSTCTVVVDVTSSTVGVHSNTSGNLTSSAGNSGTASDDLTVDASRPGFTKSFSPASVPIGYRSTLIFTIDNAANGSVVPNLDFTDNLPTGLVIADPANASTTCGTAVLPPTLTAVAGTSVITLDANGTAAFPAVAAGATCTVTVEVVANATGTLENTDVELLADFVTSGKANAALEATVTPLALIKVFTDDPVPPGAAVTLEFTITNYDRGDSITDIGFTDDLDDALSGLVAIGLPANDICGAGSTLSGTDTLTLAGGSLAPGASCTFSATLLIPGGAFPGEYPNTTNNVTGDLNGGQITGNVATDTLFAHPVPILTKEFTDDPVGAGDDVTLQYTITNSSPTSEATAIAFVDELTTFLPFPVLPVSVELPPEPCGTGSALALVGLVGIDRQGISLTGGNLAADGSCTFDVTVTIPIDLSTGTYTSTSEVITAIVNGTTYTGNPATDILDVVAGPTLRKSFTDDPVVAGGTVTLEFTLEHDPEAFGDATGITFTDDLASALAGLSATGLPLADVCGTGNGTLTGSAGDTLLTFTGGSLSPGDTCTFSVTLNTPTGVSAIGTHNNTISDITAVVNGLSVTSQPASDDLTIAGITFNKEFIDDPAIPGDTATLRFTLENVSAVDATDIFFTDNLSADLAGLTATVLPANDFCGVGSSITGTNFLIFEGGSLLAGESCTFDVTVNIPAGAAPGTYNNVTSNLTATFGGSTVPLDPATDALTVQKDWLQLTKAFAEASVLAGGTAELTFTLTNLHPVETASAITFTDDLDAALSGLAATGLPLSDICGAGSVLAGTSLVTLTGGNLAVGESCEFTVNVQIPGNTPTPATFTNTTSSITGTIKGLPVAGSPAADELRVENVTFSQSFNGPTFAGKTPILTVTIGNSGGSSPVSPLAFTNDLDATLSGLVATGLPLNDICGAGSVLAGTSLVTLTGGDLAAGGSCTFDIPLSVPVSASAGSYTNTTSNLSSNGIDIAGAASATLELLDRVTVDLTGLVDTRESDQNTTSFTVKLNTAPNGNVAINVSSLDISEGAVTPSSLLFTPSNWSIVQTVFVTGIDDLAQDGDQQYQVELTIDSADTTDTSGYTNISIDPVAVTNIDNDFPLVDNDSDGMPDGWEIYFGLNPNDSSDSTGDLDDDGVSNRLEFIKNTDPTAADNFFVSHMVDSGSAPGFWLHVISPDSATFEMYRVPQGGGEEEITSGFYSGGGTKEDPFTYQWTPASPYTSMETDTPFTGDTTYTVTFHLYANGSELPFVYTVTYKEYASDANREADIPAELLEIENLYGQTRPVAVYTQHMFDPSQSDEFTMVIQNPDGENESLTITIPAIQSDYLFIDDSGDGDGGNLDYDSQSDFYDIDIIAPGYQAFNPDDYLLIKAYYYGFGNTIVADGLSLTLEVASGPYKGFVVKYNPIQKPDGSGRDANAPAITLSLFLNPEAEAYDVLKQISDAHRLVSFMVSEKGDGVDGFARTDLPITVYEDGFAAFDINHLTAFGFIVEDADQDGLPDAWEDQFGLDKNDPSDATEDPDGDGRDNLAEFADNTDPTVADGFSADETGGSGGGGSGICFISAVGTKIPIWWISGFTVALIALATSRLNRKKALPN